MPIAVDDSVNARLLKPRVVLCHSTDNLKRGSITVHGHQNAVTLLDIISLAHMQSVLRLEAKRSSNRS